IPEPPTLPWRDLPAAEPGELNLFNLLTWRTRLVETIIGRDADRANLLAWARNGRPLAIRVLSGPGSAGKSRLAAEIAQELRDEGWTAGFAPLDRETTLPLAPRGLFLAIDYPEAHRDTVRLLLRCAAKLEQPRAPIRILLTSRQPFDWWFNEIAEAAASELCDGHSVAIGGLDAADTTRLVQYAANRLARQRGQSPPSFPPGDIQAWHARNPALHGLPLFATAAALHAVLDPAPTFALGGLAIIAALVRRERARLESAARHAHWPESAAASRLFALAGLRGGLDEPSLARLAATPDLGLPPPERVVDAVQRQGWWLAAVLAGAAPDVEILGRLTHDIGTLHPGPVNSLAVGLVASVETGAVEASKWRVVLDSEATPFRLAPLAVAIARALLQGAKSCQRVPGGTPQQLVSGTERCRGRRRCVGSEPRGRSHPASTGRG
ncbi:MAG TPA: hypothetical protein VGC80_12365, partial [Acetobacteraceae bacterium]